MAPVLTLHQGDAEQTFTDHPVEVARRGRNLDMGRLWSYSGTMEIITQEQQMTLNEAARKYHANVIALMTREITPDQHRAVNKHLRESFADPMDWERAKATALGQIAA
jgi:hypothetical protein